MYFLLVFAMILRKVLSDRAEEELYLARFRKLQGVRGIPTKYSVIGTFSPVPRATWMERICADATL